ncbi:hypothetical protein AYB34_09295 [Leptospira sp. ZV016]|nr:hypothetical protein AYB32_10295 [Leptospira kirschneri]KXZ33966.1 hypothetical protein AYB34_09295 [Leptospira sp. ZV016]
MKRLLYQIIVQNSALNSGFILKSRPTLQHLYRNHFSRFVETKYILASKRNIRKIFGKIYKHQLKF